MAASVDGRQGTRTVAARLLLRGPRVLGGGRGRCALLVAMASACGVAHAAPAPAPTIPAPRVREIGLIPDPPGTSGRDVGFSARFGGHSVWIFGDTFFPHPAADGYRWRSSTWSWTDDTDASDGLGPWSHALGADGAPLQLLPHTPRERAFNDAHNGDPCPAREHCGARHTPWPGAFVVDYARGRALVFYWNEETEPTGPWAFKATGTSIAIWPSPGAAAIRPAPGDRDAEPAALFGADEPPWGAAALVEEDTLYAYACPGGKPTCPCRVARVALDRVFDRTAWRFWSGAGWDPDWRRAKPVLDGAPLMSVHFNPYLRRFVALHMVPLTSRMAIATAPRPEGPWSAEVRFGEGLPARNGSWDYALIAHPELEREGGRIEFASYFRPGKFLDGTIRLVQITYR